MKKNDSGITLISLVITIIVLIILSSVGVISGVNTIKLSRYNKFIEEIKMVQLKVNELYDSYKNGETVTLKDGTEYSGTDILNIGNDLSSISDEQLNEIFSLVGSGITDRDRYKYYNTSTIESLDLEGIEHEFLVNVETRSVISTEPLIYEGTAYYTLAQLPDGEGLYNVQYENTEYTLTFDVTSEAQAGKGKIHITNINYQYVNKWQVRYRLQAESGQPENSWIITEEFTGNSIDIDVDKWGIYEVQVFNGDKIASEIKRIEVEVREGLKIGDYVNYVYNNAGNYIKLTESTTGTTENSLEGVTQTKGLKWRIFNIHDDGKVDLISETPTNQEVYFKGAKGYNNGVLLLNDICKELYSNKSLGIEARSINIGDIENKLSDEGIEARNKYSTTGENKYGEASICDSTSNQYPNLYAKENGSGINTTTTKADGIDINDNGYDSPTNEDSSTTNNGLTVTQSGYSLFTSSTYFSNNEIFDIIFPSNFHGFYWLASRYVLPYGKTAVFGLSEIYKQGDSNEYWITGEEFFWTNTGDTSDSFGAFVRPIVSIDYDVKITPCSNEADGTDIEHMHTISG